MFDRPIAEAEPEPEPNGDEPNGDDDDGEDYSMSKFRQSGQGGIAALIVLCVCAVVALVIWEGVRLDHRYVIQPGHVGVLDTWDRVDTNQKVYQNGTWDIAFGSSLHEVNVQPQIFKFDKVSAGGSDGQTINLDTAVTYEVTDEHAATLYVKGGAEHIFQVIVDPTVVSDLKQVIVKYSIVPKIPDSQGNLKDNPLYLGFHRDDVQQALANAVNKYTNDYGMKVIAVNITNFEGDAKFKAAVEDTAIASQHLSKSTAEAQARIAQAEGEAKAQKALASSVTELTLKQKELDLRNRELDLQQEMIEKVWAKGPGWDGHLPQVIGDATPFIQVPKLGKGPQ